MPVHYPRQPWLSPKCSLEPVPPKGVGIVTHEPIQEGETVIIWGGAYGNRAFAEGQPSMQWDDDLFSVGGDDHPAFAINHSCNPNVGVRGAFELIAMRAISPGEEIVADYAMWEANESYVSTWECQCGSDNCRKRVTGLDWQRPELQHRYRDYFSPLLQKRIQRTNAA